MTNKVTILYTSRTSSTQITFPEFRVGPESTIQSSAIHRQLTSTVQSNNIQATTPTSKLGVRWEAWHSIENPRKIFPYQSEIDSFATDGLTGTIAAFQKLPRLSYELVSREKWIMSSQFFLF